MGRRVSIIGAGFSGSALTLALLDRLQPQDQLYLVGDSMSFGRGLAYGTSNPFHLLNVPAGNMSIFPAEPRHFVHWLARRAALAETGEIDALAQRYVARATYGDYLQDTLVQASVKVGANALQVIPLRASNMERGPKGWRLYLTDRSHIRVDTVVLAMGNFMSRAVQGVYYGNPWDPHTFANVKADERILVIGTGLTAIDVLIFLETLGHTGRVDVLSRRGLLPQVHHNGHFTKPGTPSAVQWKPGLPLSTLMRAVRREIAETGAAGYCWQSVVDALRYQVQALWEALPTTERRRFLRHLKPWWDSHRHRMAPEIAERINRLLQCGRVKIIAGKILGITQQEGLASVTLRKRGQDVTDTRAYDRIIDCSGPQTDLRQAGDPFLDKLFQVALVRPDTLELGLDITADCRVLDGTGLAMGDLFAVGPLTRAAFWEIIAVPDIREQCAQIANSILP